MVEHKETILLVDDEKRITGVLRDILEGEGCIILVAANAGEALNILETREKARLPSVDQLWTDNRMPPGMTGIEFVRKLWEDPEKYPFVNNTRIVLMSATAKQDLRPEDRPLFNAVLPKPFNLDEVVALADSCRKDY